MHTFGGVGNGYVEGQPGNAMMGFWGIMVQISIAPAVEPAMMDRKALGWLCQCAIIAESLLGK